MKTKSISEMFEEISNMPQEEHSPQCITGDQFEEWLKSKKKDSITTNEINNQDFKVSLEDDFSVDFMYKKIYIDTNYNSNFKIQYKNTEFHLNKNNTTNLSFDLIDDILIA